MWSENQSCLTLCNPMDYTVHGILQARILKWVAFPFSRGSSQPRTRTHVSRVAGRSLPAEPQGEPKNTGVGSLSLLQRIFLTQESNRSLLHCRRILCQLSYEWRSLEKFYLILSYRAGPWRAQVLKRVISWRRERLPTLVFWPRDFHGLCSPRGCKESDMTEQLSLFII